MCMGNICRSPAAEGILRKKVCEAGLDAFFKIDSAGMYDAHAGELPDMRMRRAALVRGYELLSRSRPVRKDDFYRFDLIIGMDNVNIRYLRQIAPDKMLLHKVHGMTEYLRHHRADHVPDPYYGGQEAFLYVLDLLEDACDGIIEAYR